MDFHNRPCLECAAGDRLLPQEHFGPKLTMRVLLCWMQPEGEKAEKKRGNTDAGAVFPSMALLGIIKLRRRLAE
jgi:hypothetical protein